jgi:hypothetical protein
VDEGGRPVYRQRSAAVGQQAYVKPAKPEEVKPPPFRTRETPQGKVNEEFVNGQWAQVGETVAPRDPAPSAATIAKAKDKLRALGPIRQQLENVKEAWGEIQDTWSAGPGGQGMLPSPEGKRFDKAVASLSTFIRQLTRTPGEGSMSDYESKLAQSILPERGEYESVTAAQLQDLTDMIDGIESGYLDMIGGSNAPRTIEGEDEEEESLSGYPEGTMIENDKGERMVMRNGKWTKL